MFFDHCYPFPPGTTERKHEIKKIPPERPETLPNRTEEKGMKSSLH